MSLSSAVRGAVTPQTRRLPAFTILHFMALMPLALVAGSVFGIWRGYNPALWQAETFLEVHQGAVRGLNILLPAMAAVSMICTAILAFTARRSMPLLLRYGAALVCMVAAGLITRFGNQPINAEIMTWTVATIPAGWELVRDRWWDLHIMRFAATLGALVFLAAAIFHDCRQD